jgi:GR25 family glycosyltransferase involved in LPS biosynthesis
MRQSESIPTYIINLEGRKDRLRHIKKEFELKTEFEIKVVKAIKHEVGAFGLWQTIVNCVRDAKKLTLDYILICEDDHKFTGFYSKEIMFDLIAKSRSMKVDVLLGGVSRFSNVFQVDDNLFWVDKFSGTQFTIVFKAFYDRILNSDFTVDDHSDYKICELSEKCVLIHPIISVQKEIGNSDISVENSMHGRVEELYEKVSDQLFSLEEIIRFYKGIAYPSPKDRGMYDDFVIPTYVINLPERTDRLKHIKNEFKNRKEFDIKIIEASRNKIGAVGLWNSIVNVVKMAIKNDDDVIIICEDDHCFTKNYNKRILMENILDAHNEGADYVSGGTGKFGYAIPVASNRFWVNICLSTQFIIIYRKFFQSIINESFLDSDCADIKLSEMTANKMVLFPFISNQFDFGYSDVTSVHNEIPGVVRDMFDKSSARLEKISKAHGIFKRKIVR